MAPLSCRRTTNDRAYLIIASGRSIICHRRWRCVRPAPSSPAPSPAVHMVVLRVGSSVAASSLLRVGRSCDSCMQCTPPFAVTAVFDTGYTPWVGGGATTYGRRLRELCSAGCRYRVFIYDVRPKCTRPSQRGDERRRRRGVRRVVRRTATVA